VGDVHGFTSSIVSYPDRGPDGNAKYRGNTSGRLVRDFIVTYHGPKTNVFVDPMEGGGTSRDAAAAMGVPYRGFDLRDGFDAVRMDLLAALDGVPCGSVFIHPPYAAMIQYSGNMWGEPHPADLSQFGNDVDAFHELLQAVLQNVHAALRPGGHYGVLLGSWRKAGAYHNLPATLTRYAPGVAVAEIVKVQHNVQSGRKHYSGSVVRIEHESLLVYRRADDPSIFAVFAEVLDAVNRSYSASWRNLVLGFARERGTFGLDELYEAFDNHPRTKSNPNYQAKLRQIVNSEATIKRYSRGRYGLAGRVAS